MTGYLFTWECDVLSLPRTRYALEFCSSTITRWSAHIYPKVVFWPTPSPRVNAKSFNSLVKGSPGRIIASLLGISLKTAEFCGTRLMRKLDIHETASLVRYALRRGLIQP